MRGYTRFKAWKFSDNQPDDHVYVDGGVVLRTVQIDDFGIAATDFNLTPAEKDKLYDSGVQATEAFLKIPVLNPSKMGYL